MGALKPGCRYFPRRLRHHGRARRPPRRVGAARFNSTYLAGAASVAIFDAEADLDDIGAIYVQPAADHWECFMQRPILNPAETNVIRLRPLAFSHAVKPEGETPLAWGRELMGLDQLATGLTGAGVRIGLIDSGCDNSHP